MLIYLEIMSQGKTLDDLQEAVKMLEEHGYRVTRPVVRIQKNVEVDKNLWDRLESVRETQNMLIRECVEEAIELWLKHKSQSDPTQT